MGTWNPKLDADVLIDGLRHMCATRAYDDGMFRAQRQGKTSFYVDLCGFAG